MKKISIMLVLTLLVTSCLSKTSAAGSIAALIAADNVTLDLRAEETKEPEENVEPSQSSENVSETVGDSIIQTEEEKKNQENESNQEVSEESTEEQKEEDSAETTAQANETTKMDLTARSAILMEGSTGQIIYENNKDEQVSPASITKIMTLLLIFEALESGKIKLTDEVSVSEHAASMGGSQVYLEPYEVQTVDTMIKCISIASANDASVAMGEYIAGSEEEFVSRMNARAKELGMENTHFENCTGLPSDNHYSSAYDVALMSRELIVNYPQISDYSTIWMDTIIHTTKKGQSEFGLSNTNKLVKTYDGITGLKTGSTDKAKYCLSATANRNNMNMIAVIMGATEHKARFTEAAKLLDYGYANCSIYSDENKDLNITPTPVKKGVDETVNGVVNEKFSYLCLTGSNPEEITKEITLNESLTAPILKNDVIGEIGYYMNNSKIGSIPVLAEKDVPKAKYKDYFFKLIIKYFVCEKKNS